MIDAPISLSYDQEKRVCERVDHNRPVLLKLSSGKFINGFTQNVSLGGVRVKIQGTNTDDINFEEIPSQSASLQVKLTDETLSSKFPCTIVRCESGMLCLEIEKKKAASFGIMLMRGVLKRKQ
jgi:hypothetical protein